MTPAVAHTRARAEALAYVLGRHARRGGQPRSSCPFSRPEFAHRWRQGWDTHDAWLTSGVEERTARRQEAQ